MAKPNYSFAKRQREIAKKQKKEEKRLRKAGPEDGAAEGSPEAVVQSPAAGNESTPLSLPKADDSTP
ncbi:MAG: hypothetical protein EBT83_10665 [Betaproteobacteria bacterium]|nr:hypothetical protein [Betaproteobacteria bacterium]